MRRLFLLGWMFTCTACLAGGGGPLPEIEVGTSERAMMVHGPPRVPEDGGLYHQTFLVGTVTEVSAEEDRQPQRIKLSESCTLYVEAAYGHLQAVAGIRTVVLKASYEQSPYAPIEEDWGKLWHFKKGQRLVVILHRAEGGLCFDKQELMALDERTATLPDILRRTGLSPYEFRTADLEVLGLASPYLHQQVLAMTADKSEVSAEETRRGRDAMTKLGGICVLVVLGAWGLWKMRK